jgi:hypothetical protein
MTDPDVTFAELDFERAERFQTVRRELGVDAFGRAWESWEDGGPGRPPQEVSLPDDLPES